MVSNNTKCCYSRALAVRCIPRENENFKLIPHNVFFRQFHAVSGTPVFSESVVVNWNIFKEKTENKTNKSKVHYRLVVGAS